MAGWCGIAMAVHGAGVLAPGKTPPEVVRRLNAELAANTGQPLEKIERDVERDYFMNSEQAKNYGLIDHIIDKRAAGPVAA